MNEPSRRVRFHSRSSASSNARAVKSPVRESVNSNTESLSSKVLRSVMSRMTMIFSRGTPVAESHTMRCLISTHAIMPSFMRMRTMSRPSRRPAQKSIFGEEKMHRVSCPSSPPASNPEHGRTMEKHNAAPCPPGAANDVDAILGQKKKAHRIVS